MKNRQAKKGCLMGIKDEAMKHVFIIGSKGIPAQYGGFETFVENLTGQAVSKDIFYHIACMSEEEKEEWIYNGAECFYIKVPHIGSAVAVYYDLAAFRWCLDKIEKEHIKDPVVYVLACRIGPFVGPLERRLHRLGGKLYVNPDGHEFKRAKWNWMIRKYWKCSERLMVKHADLMICDSKNIEKYMKEDYRQYHPATTFIPYGTVVSEEQNVTEKLQAWYDAFHLERDGYYLVVGRFVPENNYETMIREFMNTDSSKKLVLISNIEENGFYGSLKELTHFDTDDRIVFTGTVYDADLLTQIRNGAYAYIHGHEVGGTNPSLLESLGSTKLNLLLDVGFNSEVGMDCALYWTKQEGNLCELIKKAELMTEEERRQLGDSARERMKEYYSWESVVKQYEDLFLGVK